MSLTDVCESCRYPVRSGCRCEPDDSVTRGGGEARRAGIGDRTRTGEVGSAQAVDLPVWWRERACVAQRAGVSAPVRCC
jgi:hypothetical protein